MLYSMINTNSFALPGGEDGLRNERRRVPRVPRPGGDGGAGEGGGENQDRPEAGEKEAEEGTQAERQGLVQDAIGCLCCCLCTTSSALFPLTRQECVLNGIFVLSVVRLRGRIL